MRPLDFTLILIVFCATWQTGASAQPPTPPSTATPGLISTAPAAQALLDAAIKTLTKPEGVDVKFVQTIFNRSQPATITGRSVTAPGKRSLVELDYQQMKRQAKLKVLCDGDTFYRLTALPESNQLMTYKMKDLQEALDKLASNEAERVAKEDVEKHQQGLHGFDGIAAQLKDLSKRMFFSAPVETILELPGKPKQTVKMIEGQWTPAMVDMIAPNKKTDDPRQQDLRYLWNERLDFFQVPRSAKIYFDAATGHLIRLELLGITERKGADKLLVSLDVTSLTFPTTLDTKLFKPTEAELKYTSIPIDMAAMIKSSHAQMMNTLKLQQQQQSQNERK
jgi:hypothetical protein